MQQTLTVYDREHAGLNKAAPDYQEQCRVWWDGQQKAERVVWDALCEVLYAAHYKLMETSGGYAVDHAAVDRLDGAIETILEAMPDHAKTHFDALMQRPCER